MVRMPVSGAVPRQAELDGLLRRARKVRVLEGGAARGRPLGGPVLATFEGAEIEALREALRIVEDGEPFHCMCHGDLAIDLRGRLLRIGVISYHHGVSIRLEGAGSDADLVDGPALLRLLAARGVKEPLERFEVGGVAGETLAAAEVRWREATPELLRERLDEIGTGPMGLPRHENDTVYDETVASLREGGAGDRAIAAELLAWVGCSDSPWSGFPAYECVPLVLLRRLAPAAVLEAIEAADDEASLLGAARFVCEHEVVSFRKRMVAAVSPERFDAFAQRLERTPMDEDGLVDARARLRAARGIATEARERKARLAAERERGGGLVCVAVSEDGPFGELVTDGERLVALDVYTVVDVDVDTGELTPLATYSGSPFTELVFVDGVLFAVRNNLERLDRIDGGAEPRVVVDGLPRPMQPVACGGIVCMISAPFEEYPGEGGIKYSRQRTSLVRVDPDGSMATVIPVERGVAFLTADATHLYFSSTDLDGKGVLERVARGGGKAERLAELKGGGHTMARPRMVVDGAELVYADGNSVCRVPVTGGKAQVIAKLSEPVAAIEAVDGGYVAIAGDSSADEWHVERIGREGKHERVGTLPRRPYHRLAMVSRRGQAYFVMDDRMYRVR